MKSARSNRSPMKAAGVVLAFGLFAAGALVNGETAPHAGGAGSGAGAPPNTAGPGGNQIARKRQGTIVPRSGGIAGASSADFRNAVGLSASDVISINFGSSDGAGLDVFTSAVGSFPSQGTSYFVMSTGNTASALTPNSAPNTSTELGGLNNSQGNDMTQVTIVLSPPAGATCIAFDFAFYSEEFPEYVGSEFNDAFIAEIGNSNFQIVNNQIIAPANFAFDTDGNVISVNTTFGVNEGNAAGTTYDGATPFLTAVSPIEGIINPNVTITLSIMDLGDSIFDSTVFIDNFRWFYALDCVPGADADTDGDALLDDWETNGIDFDHDGNVDLDLPAMGADPMHKDVFVEVDYMELSGTGGHSHKPKAEALQIAIDTFENSPMTNPDGTTGVHAHIDAGADTIMNPVTGELWGSMSRSDALAHQTNLGTVASPYSWAAFDTIKGVGVAGNFDIQRGDVFHYCIFAHNLAAGNGSTSGIARDLPSSDFIVSLGGWTGSVGTINEQAGTFLHEFGHNLGLRHGGNDHGNYKANYLSVMNYNFQTKGLRFNSADGLFDYSRFHLPDLNENALNETLGLSGVGGTATYGTRFWNGTAGVIVNDINVAIDWNQDADGGADVAVVKDINKSGDLTVLGNSDNWAEIKFNGGAVGHLGEQITLPDSGGPEDIDEPTDDLIVAPVNVCVAGPAVVTLQACESETYSYTLLNKGSNADVYEIEVTQNLPWANTSSIPNVFPLPPGSSVNFDVPILVPQGTPDGTVHVLKITATSMTNPLFKDVATTTTTAQSVDTDGDGFTDLCDACPNSILTPTIVLGNCDSGVPNKLFDDGCTMSDLIKQCKDSAVTHGSYVSCVAKLTNQWKAQGLISGAQKGKIQSCAAKDKR